jgi:hypothetical protein
MSSIDSLGALSRVLSDARHLGVKQLRNGTELIGYAPHVGPQAWLHVLFAGLSASKRDAVEAAIQRSLPPPYWALLQRFNGLSLFSGALALFGLRESYRRTGDAQWQPFALETPNVVERPQDARPHTVFVGSFRSDGSLLFMDPSDSQVYRRSHHSARVLTSWSSLESMLNSEALRLAELYDSAGRRKSGVQSTAPPTVSG